MTVGRFCKFFGLLFVSTCWATLVAVSSQHNSAHSQPQNPAKTESTEIAASKNVEDRLANYTLWLVIFTAVLAGSTIGLWIVTWRSGIRQSKDMERATTVATDATKAAITSNQIAVTNAEQQLRAYVTARDMSLRTHRRPAQMGAHGVVEGAIHTYELAAILHNGGQTPATNVVINVSCQRMTSPLADTFGFPDSTLFGYGVIGPKGEQHTPSIRISAADLEDILAGTDCYFWGWVEYDDIFEGTLRHRTEFCFRIERIRLPITNELFIGFYPHSRYNAVDQRCLRPIDPHTNRST
jgi:hypothetical protein